MADPNQSRDRAGEQNQAQSQPAVKPRAQPNVQRRYQAPAQQNPGNREQQPFKGTPAVDLTVNLLQSVI